MRSRPGRPRCEPAALTPALSRGERGTGVRLPLPPGEGRGEGAAAVPATWDTTDTVGVGDHSVSMTVGPDDPAALALDVLHDLPGVEVADRGAERVAGLALGAAEEIELVVVGL